MFHKNKIYTFLLPTTNFKGQSGQQVAQTMFKLIMMKIETKIQIKTKHKIDK